MTFTFQLLCKECGDVVEHDCAWEPDVPPVPCMDPDHAHYADPGSAGSVDAPETCPHCNAKVDQDDAWQQGQQAYADACEEAAEREAENRMDELRERGRRW